MTDKNIFFTSVDEAKGEKSEHLSSTIEMNSMEHEKLFVKYGENSDENHEDDLKFINKDNVNNTEDNLKDLSADKNSELHGESTEFELSPLEFSEESTIAESEELSEGESDVGEYLDESIVAGSDKHASNKESAYNKTEKVSKISSRNKVNVDSSKINGKKPVSSPNMHIKMVYNPRFRIKTPNQDYISIIKSGKFIKEARILESPKIKVPRSPIKNNFMPREPSMSPSVSVRRNKSPKVISPKPRQSSATRTQHKSIRNAKMEKMYGEFLINPNKVSMGDKDLDYIHNHIQESYEYALNNEDYDEVSKIERARNSINLRRKFYENRKEGYINKVQRQNELCELTKYLSEEWRYEFNQFMNTFNNDLNKILEQNKEELAEFDSKVPREVVLRYVPKEVEELRDRERSYAKRYQFRKANDLRKGANYLMEIEKMKALQSAQKNFLRKRTLLLQKHKRKVDCLVSRANSQRSIMIKGRNLMLMGLCKRIEIISDDVENYKKLGYIKNSECKQHELSEEKLKEIIEREGPMLKANSIKSGTRPL